MSKKQIKQYVVTGVIAIVAVGLANRYAQSKAPGAGVVATALGG
jgi:hypothetical protein